MQQPNVITAYQGIARLSEILGFKVPICGIMSAVLRRPTIDIIRLDDELKRRYDYPEDFLSMADFIRHGWGDEADRLVEKFI